MKVGVFINTPAQFHFYKNIIKKLKDHDHEVYILARDYGETIDLLQESGLPHYVYSQVNSSKFKKVGSFPIDTLKAYFYLKKRNVELVTGFGVSRAYFSSLFSIPDIAFSDGEPMIKKIYSIQYRLFMPFINAIITPSSFRQNLGNKHIKVNSYKELSYLHPKYYTPDPSIFELLGIDRSDEYVLLRFNAFDTVHDIGIHGFNLEDKIELVNKLKRYTHVFISSEAKVPKVLEKYILRIPKSRIHDVLYYAKLFIADTGTMVTEAAILGTPAIRVHPDSTKYGIFAELQDKYGLIFTYTTPEPAIEKAIELIQYKNLKKEWKKKRKVLLREKIDIAEFMTWFIEEYPESLEIIKQNPNIQYYFK